MTKQSEKDTPRVLKQCLCGATMWQGPFIRGPIVNGELVAQETLYQCVNCNRTMQIDQMVDREVPVFGL